jgi:hypothetical protein
MLILDRAPVLPGGVCPSFGPLYLALPPSYLSAVDVRAWTLERLARAVSQNDRDAGKMNKAKGIHVRGVTTVMPDSHGIRLPSQ